MKLPILIAVFVFFCIPAGGVRAATEPLTDDQALAIARQVVDSLNKGDTDAAYSRFNEEMKKAVTPEQLEGVWKGLIFAKGEYQGESSYAIRDVGEYTSVVLTLRFRNEEQMVVVTFSRDGRLAGLHTPPMPVKTELAPDEQEVAFTSGGNTVYGTLRLPANSAGKAPALLLISGSGPTDRDGNSRMLPGKTESHRHLARILADAGIASLRYDKFGVGKTPLGRHADNINNVDFDVFVTLALDGFDYLGRRPEIDPSRVGFLGHSEGALIAMAATDRMKQSRLPAALILAMPSAKAYMTIIRGQFEEQYAAAVRMGQVTRRQADEALGELDRILDGVRRNAEAPEKMSPQFAPLFLKQNLKFLQTADRYDPLALAAGFPPGLSVALFCGEKDQQVSCEEAGLLVESFRRAGNSGLRFARLADVNHVFKEVAGEPNPTVDYVDPAKPFSREAQRVLTEFVREVLLPPVR